MQLWRYERCESAMEVAHWQSALGYGGDGRDFGSREASCGPRNSMSYIISRDNLISGRADAEFKLTLFLIRPGALEE